MVEISFREKKIVEGYKRKPTFIDFLCPHARHMSILPIKFKALLTFSYGI
ncbi:hypothetical protein HanRHA438_Chr13g0615611 [Helianthus annuus]|nr:hypothetical protein HanRHA438_Chr13g0615611 [Helianthus annuus]